MTVKIEDVLDNMIRQLQIYKMQMVPKIKKINYENTITGLDIHIEMES